MKTVTDDREESCINIIMASYRHDFRAISIKARGFDCTLIYFVSSYVVLKTVIVFAFQF